MSDEEKIDKWIAEHDGEDYCEYCIYNDDCPHGTTCYGNHPIEPPCCSQDINELLDKDTILEDIKSGEN